MGIRYGGRAKGTPNKRTVEAALAIEAGLEGKILAKDALEEVLSNFMDLKRSYEPLPGEKATPEQEAGMERWGNNAKGVAAALAPYQSPTYKAIFMPDQHDMEGELTEFFLNVFEKQRTPPKLIEHKSNGKDAQR